MFIKNREVMELKQKIEELEQENCEMKETIRRLKDVHAERVDDLKDKIKTQEIEYEQKINEMKNEYTRWIQETRHYNKDMGIFMEKIMIKDIELNDLMTKLIIK